jgi:hypothetical protein
MRPFVAGFLVLATFTSGSFAQSRTQNKTATQRVRSETIRICQGVPIPDGYVIVGYLTSSACPHGAYLVKKQQSYDSDLATERTNQPANPADSTTGNNATKSRRTRTPQTSPNSNRAQTASAPAARRSQRSQDSAGTASGSAAASSTRPRRVTAEEEVEPTGPPKLIGAETAKASGPPQLINPRAQSDAANTGDTAERSAYSRRSR